MNFTFDLSNLEYQRLFVVGDILGEYDRLINLLYQQRFGHKDILVTTGDFINIDTAFEPATASQLETILFLKNIMNAYSVKGKNEFDFLRKIENEDAPVWLHDHPKSGSILFYRRL